MPESATLLVLDVFEDGDAGQVLGRHRGAVLGRQLVVGALGLDPHLHLGLRRVVLRHHGLEGVLGLGHERVPEHHLDRLGGRGQGVERAGRAAGCTVSEVPPPAAFARAARAPAGRRDEQAGGHRHEGGAGDEAGRRGGPRVEVDMVVSRASALDGTRGEAADELALQEDEQRPGWAAAARMAAARPMLDSSTLAADSDLRPIWIVSHRPWVTTARGHVYWFQALRNEMTANEAMTGRVPGWPPGAGRRGGRSRRAGRRRAGRGGCP